MPRDVIEPAQSHWYAAMTEPLSAVESDDVKAGEEWAVRRRLKARGIKHYLAIEEVRTRRHGGWGNPRLVPFLPGYVFVQLGEPRHAEAQVKGIRGIVTLLRGASPLPFVMPVGLIDAIREHEASDGVIRQWVTTRPEARFHRGQQVRVIDGIWRSFVGEILKLRRHERALTLIGKLEIELGLDQVEAVA